MTDIKVLLYFESCANMKKSMSAPCLIRMKSASISPCPQTSSLKHNPLSCSSLATISQDIAALGELSSVFHTPIHQVAMCLATTPSESYPVTIPAPSINAIYNEELAACLITPCNDQEESSTAPKMSVENKSNSISPRARRKKRK